MGLVGVIAVVNALQCYWDPGYTSRRIYTLDPKQGLLKIQTDSFDWALSFQSCSWSFVHKDVWQLDSPGWSTEGHFCCNPRQYGVQGNYFLINYIGV